MEHSKTPWKVGTSPAGKSVVFLVGDEPDHTLGPDANWIDCNTEANARRIVACVNACRGIRTEDLERRVHALASEDDTISLLQQQLTTERASLFAENQRKQQLEQQVDELLWLLRKFDSIMEGCGNWPDTSTSQVNLGDLAAEVRATIAAVKGE